MVHPRAQVLSLFGVPLWLQSIPKPEAWVRLKTDNAPPYNVRRLGDDRRSWRLIVLEVQDGFDVVAREEWSTGDNWVDGRDTSDSPGPGWGSQGRYTSWTDHHADVPVGAIFSTWESARGGWPLPGDAVICSIPEGELRTTIVRCANPNDGAYLFEVAGGRQLPVGCMSPVRKP